MPVRAWPGDVLVPHCIACLGAASASAHTRGAKEQGPGWNCHNKSRIAAWKAERAGAWPCIMLAQDTLSLPGFTANHRSAGYYVAACQARLVKPQGPSSGAAAQGAWRPVSQRWSHTTKAAKMPLCNCVNTGLAEPQAQGHHYRTGMPTVLRHNMPGWAIHGLAQGF